MTNAKLYFAFYDKRHFNFATHLDSNAYSSTIIIIYACVDPDLPTQFIIGLMTQWSSDQEIAIQTSDQQCANNLMT